MSDFFSSSGADDQRPDSSHPSSGDNFFSFNDAPLFKNDDNSGGSFFGNSSSSGGGGDHESFFKPSSASKNEGGFLDFDSALSKPEVEPTQECHSDLGSNKERKKDSQQGKKIPGKDLTKARKRLSRQNSTIKCVYLRVII